jgi:NAD(P)-dependent dehydrogenase (short-subunit alcohol dehydrogenase family)
MRLDGKSIVITGGGRGLGREMARLFTEEGAQVVIGDIVEAFVDDAVEEITQAGGTVVGKVVDVSRREDVEALVALAVERFGKLDVMCNNAGIPPTGIGNVPVEETTDEAWDRIVAVNLSSVFYGCRAAVAPMRANGGGSIINTSSAASFLIPPGWTIYSAVKGGVNLLTKGMAVDLGKYNIRVNALCPKNVSLNFMEPEGAPFVEETSRDADWGPTKTEMPLKVGRPPRLRDHAYLALYLASDESLYTSGQLITVDGGTLARMPHRGITQ